MCKFCSSEAVSKGMCRIHYGRWYRTGNPEGTGQGHRKDAKPIQQRIADYHVVLENGCHEWTSGINQYGYGKVKYQGRTLGAHTVAWFLATGAWPAEELDHLCHTLDKECVGGVECRHRRCINPAHMEQVTKSENTRRRDARRRL
jgi:hypothetical protein